MTQLAKDAIESKTGIDQTEWNEKLGSTAADVAAMERKLGMPESKWRGGRPEYTVILMHGESNAQGIPVNTDAQAWEVAAGRSELMILNNSSLAFEALDVGTNNGGASAAQHGWELALANGVRLGDLPSPVYCVKTGRGGSRLSEWTPGNATGYWSDLVARVTAAEQGLGKGNINWIVWNSSGINEQRDGTNAAIYKSAQVVHFAELRAHLGQRVPIIMMRTMADLPEYDADYETAVDEIVADDDYTWAVSSDDLTLEVDNTHWNYLGIKRGAQRLMEQTQTILGVAEADRPAVEWTALENATNVGQEIVCGTGTDAGGRSTRAIDNRYDWAVIGDFEAGADAVVCIAVDDNQDTNYAWNTDYFLASFVWVGGVAYYGDPGTLINAATGFSFPGKVRLAKSGNDITVSSSTDGGLTWTVRHMVAGVLAGKTNLWVKCIFQAPAATKRIRVSIQQ